MSLIQKNVKTIFELKNLYTKNFIFLNYFEPLKRTEKSYKNQYTQDMIKKKCMLQFFQKRWLSEKCKLTTPVVH